jgi:pilus assembly protein CpaE
VEFGLLAPVLILAMVATVDLGFAISQKMQIDRSLRAGADGLMAGNYEGESTTTAQKEEKLRKLVEAIATGAVSNQQPADFEMSEDDLDITVDRFCACPESLKTEVSCTTATCAASARRFLFYRVSASQSYDAILLPSIPLEGSVLVQVE